MDRVSEREREAVIKYRYAQANERRRPNEGNNVRRDRNMHKRACERSRGEGETIEYRREGGSSEKGKRDNTKPATEKLKKNEKRKVRDIHRFSLNFEKLEASKGLAQIGGSTT